MLKGSLDSIKRALAQELLSVTDEAAFEARHIMMEALGESLESIILNGSEILSDAEIARIEDLKTRRLQGVPLALVLGQWQFYALDLAVNEHTLIPRPETELLVDFCLKQSLKDDASVIDLGTGSGAIAIALGHMRPLWAVTASEKSTEALCMAKKNARRHHLTNIKFVASSWWKEISQNARFDLIVSNPPYIDIDDEHVDSSVRKHEPAMALFADNEGLADIEEIIDGAQPRLKSNGLLAIEHGFRQGSAVRTLMHRYEFVDVITLKDQHNLDRFTCAHKGN